MIRLERDDALGALRRVGVAAEFFLQIAAIEQRVDVTGIERDRRVVARNRFGGPASPVSRTPRL